MREKGPSIVRASQGIARALFGTHRCLSDVVAAAARDEHLLAADSAA
jgi:hypothetical protein